MGISIFFFGWIVPFGNVVASLSAGYNEKAVYRLHGFFNLLLFVGDHSLLLDAGFLTRKVTQVVDACATNDTDLVNLDLVDVGRIEREDTLNAYAVGDFADSEHLGLARTLDLDNYAAEALQTLLVTLDDAVGYGDRVTSLE